MPRHNGLIARQDRLRAYVSAWCHQKMVLPKARRRLSFGVMTLVLGIGAAACSTGGGDLESRALSVAAQNYEDLVHCASRVFSLAPAQVSEDDVTHGMRHCLDAETLGVPFDRLRPAGGGVSNGAWLRDVTIDEERVSLYLAVVGRADNQGVTAGIGSRSVVACLNLHGTLKSSNVQIEGVACEQGLVHSLGAYRNDEVSLGEIQGLVDPPGPGYARPNPWDRDEEPTPSPSPATGQP